MCDPTWILLAEDDDDDAFLIRRTFERAKILNPMAVVKNGEEAIAYLKGEGPYGNRTEYPLPGLVLLDLKMPRTNGFEVLSWLREQPELRTLPVVVLTSSTDVRDVNLAFQLGANGFVIKPVDFLRFVEFSEALDGRWLWLSKAPELALPLAALAVQCSARA